MPPSGNWNYRASTKDSLARLLRPAGDWPRACHLVISHLPAGRWTWRKNTPTQLGTDHLLVLGHRSGLCLGLVVLDPGRVCDLGWRMKQCAGLMFIPIQPGAAWTVLQEGQWRNSQNPKRPTPFSSFTGSMDMSLSKLWEIVKDRESWHVAFHSVVKSWTWLSDWTTTSQAHHLHPGPIGPACAELTLHILWSLCTKSLLSDHFLQWLVTNTGLGLEEGRERLRENCGLFLLWCSQLISVSRQQLLYVLSRDLFSLVAVWLAVSCHSYVTSLERPSKAIQSKASSLNTFHPSSHCHIPRIQ